MYAFTPEVYKARLYKHLTKAWLIPNVKGVVEQMAPLWGHYSMTSSSQLAYMTIFSKLF